MGNKGSNPTYARYIGEEKIGESRVLRSNFIDEKEEIPYIPYPGCTSMIHAFEKTVNKYTDKNFLGTRTPLEGGKFGPYQWKSFSQVRELAQSFSKGLNELKLCPEIEGDGLNLQFLGIYSKNREEWLISDLACHYNSITSVCFYDTLGPESVEFVINQTELTSIACSGMYVKNLVELKKTGKIHSLQHLISFDIITEEDRALAESANISLYHFSGIVQAGRVSSSGLNISTPEVIATFCYTSGTTGVPKAAMVTEKNLMAECAGIMRAGLSFSHDDILLSYLPLPHMLERIVSYIGIIYGIQYGFYQGDVLKLTEDIAVLRPTIFVSVPRLFSRFYDVIQAKIKDLTGMKKRITEAGLRAKTANLRSAGSYTHAIYDRLVFNKMKGVLGGRVRLMITGSAPISPDVLDFLKVCFCCPVLEGYGQTETCAASTLTSIDDKTSGHVGAPVSSNDVKLVDVPEMNYTSKDTINGQLMPRGEVCFRGPNVFKGYYKAKDKNDEAFDSEGWLHSGDIGVILPSGAIQLIDRKKNIFKLAQGEYIAPEKIENVLVKSPFVSQIFVYGDSLQSYLVAVITLDEKAVQKWANANSINPEDLIGNFNNPQLLKAILADFQTLSKEAKLNSLEQPKKIHIEGKAFTVESGLLTPTMKIKRHEAKLTFASQIEEMYATGLEARK